MLSGWVPGLCAWKRGWITKAKDGSIIEKKQYFEIALTKLLIQNLNRIYYIS